MHNSNIDKPRILIADDSPTVTGILSYIFSEEGFVVDTAADGVEAIRRFYHSPPDLVVLDIEMPRMNGYQVCRLLKDDPEALSVPVVILTSRDLQSDRFRGLASGADAYIVKNLEDDQLLQSARDLLKQAHVRDVHPPKPKPISEAEIFQSVNRLLDRKLFISTVNSEVETANASVRDYSAARKVIVQMFSKVFEYVVGGVVLSGPDGADITISLLEGFSEDNGARFADSLFSEAVKGKAISPEAKKIVEILRHTPAGSKLFPTTIDLTDWLFWPLSSRGIVFGIIGMAGTAPLKFDQEGKELIEHFIRRAQITLDNARLIALQEATNLALERTLNELKKTQTQLVQSEKLASLGMLMAGLTHEMNNPLNFIAGNLEHLDRYTANLFRLVEAAEAGPNLEEVKKEIDFEFLKADAPGLLHDLREGVNRARNIISDLRTFSSQDRGGIVPTDLAALVNSTLNILRHEWEEDCEIVRDFADIPLFDCKLSQIGQVVMNLLSNAIKAVRESGHKGKVTVALKKIESSIILSVADEGVGIADENIGKLFQPFFTTREVGKGMGLGLSISYGIVSRHGGEIEVISELGRGSEFKIKLPVQSPVNMAMAN